MRDGWREVRLGDVCAKIGSGATPRGGKQAYKKHGISFIRSQNILDFYFFPDGLAFIDDKQAALLKNVIVQPNDVMINITGDSVARTCSVPNALLPARVNQHVAIVRGNSDVVENDFILYELQRIKPYLLSIASTGGTRNALTKSMIENIQFALPPLPEQRVIAATLSCLDDKIELNNKINANLEAQAQAIFKSWFVDFEPFRDGEFVDSELGPIPKGWRVGRLSEIANITMGQSPSGSSYNENGDGVVFFQGRAEFGWRFPTIRLYTTEPKRMAQENDILISVRAPVGDINVAKSKCCIGRGLSAVHSKTGHQTFILYLLMQSKRLLDAFNGEGTVFGSINQKAFNSLEVLVPPKEIIEQFDTLCRPFDLQIRVQSEQNDALAALRDTLLPKLMSGEITVPDAEKIFLERI